MFGARVMPLSALSLASSHNEKWNADNKNGHGDIWDSDERMNGG